MVEYETLPVKQWCVSELHDEGLDIAPENVTAHWHYRVEWMAYQLTLSFHVPTKHLERRLIGTYPTTWWDALKARLGWKHQRTEIWFDSQLVFPSIAVPPWANKMNVRVAFTPETRFREYVS